MVLVLYHDLKFWLVYPDDTRGSTTYEGNYRIEGRNIVLEPIAQGIQRLELPAKLKYFARPEVIVATFDDSIRRHEIRLVRDPRFK